MRIHAIMPVGPGEADRYLESSLAWLSPMVDTLLCYIDEPKDADSIEIARLYATETVVRSEEAVAFLSHEGTFRSQLWAAFEHFAQPEVGDWVLANDADEWLVDAEGRLGSGPGGVLGTLRGACAMTSAVGIILPVPEVFEVLATGLPLVRKDGFWGDIRGPRLFRYRPNGRYSNKPLGCGAEPGYVSQGPLSAQNYGLALLHYGYADPEDRQMKYKRYTSLSDHGHDDRHIQSILQSPVLHHWDGPIPEVYRGRR